MPSRRVRGVVHLVMRLALLFLVIVVSGCSHRRSPSHDDEPEARSEQPSTLPGTASVEVRALPPDPPIAKDRPLVYLVSSDNFLYSFDPNRPGLAAYSRVGHIGCTSESVDSMAVDQKSTAGFFTTTDRLPRSTSAMLLAK